MFNFPRGCSLIDGTSTIWIPYDLKRQTNLPARVRPLWDVREVLHSERQPFCFDAPLGAAVYVVCGMGIMLGDSIIGLTALSFLKESRPDISLRVCRPSSTGAYVEELYWSVPWLIDHVQYMPAPSTIIPDEAIVIDLADTLFRPSFAELPMVDFWIKSLGLIPQDVPQDCRRNSWLKRVVLPVPSLRAPKLQEYVLFCPRASVPLRSIPDAHLRQWVERIHKHYNLPIVGFQPIEHPQYFDVSAYSQKTMDYFSWIAGATALIATDSAAIHVAAGYDVPTLAFFVSIDPTLRVRDYPLTTSIDIRTASTDGLHETDDHEQLHAAAESWDRLIEMNEIPWPDLRKTGKTSRDFKHYRGFP